MSRTPDALAGDEGIIVQSDPANVTTAFTQRLLAALEHHRFPDREQ